MAKGSDNPFPSMLVVEGTTPSSPASGDQRVFIDSSDHKLKRVNASGAVTTIEGGGVGTQGKTSVVLDYAASTDLFNGTSLTNATWTDLISNQSFTLAASDSLVLVQICAAMTVGGGGVVNVATRIVIDSAGTAINKQLGGGLTPSGAYTNPFGGDGAVPLSSLASGSHTVKVQLYADGSGLAMYLRASTKSNTEFLNARVLELRQS